MPPTEKYHKGEITQTEQAGQEGKHTTARSKNALHQVEPDQIHGSIHRETAADPPAIGVDLVTFALETQGSREEIMHHLLKFQAFHSQ